MNDNLELAATLWLAGPKRCMIVLRETCPFVMYCGQPDAYGVTAARYGIEIEIKRSMSDFYADQNKHSRRNREFDNWLWAMPKYFFYLVPQALAEKAKAALPSWAGLLSFGTYGMYGNLDVMVDAPANRESRKLTLKDCAKLARQMSVYAARCDQRLDAWQRRWGESWESYHWDYAI